MQMQQSRMLSEGIDDKIKSFGIELADKLSKNSKNDIVTKMLVDNDLAKDKDRLKAISRQNAGQLNQYLNEIDYEALAETNDGLFVANKMLMALKLSAIPIATSIIIGFLIGKRF